MQPYTDGDLVLLGANLPHEWRSDYQHQHQDDMASSSLAVHFLKDFPGKEFYIMPEAAALRKLLEAARQGIKINDSKTVATVQQQLKEMLATIDSLERVIRLFSVLNTIVHSTNLEKLASEGFAASFQNTNQERINVVYKYVMQHFKDNISLEEIAASINMTPTAFCRYFRKSTHKSFVQYLNEIRIGYACKLLMEGKFTIAQIAYESGFRNLSNFNKHFKEIIGKTPTYYTKEHGVLNI